MNVYLQLQCTIIMFPCKWSTLSYLLKM
jgi:hypothetical protein